MASKLRVQGQGAVRLTVRSRVAPGPVLGNSVLAYNRLWQSCDARGEVLGRLATRIAIVLMGKHKPIYDPANDCGDIVVVTNAKHIVVTGRKAQQKLYTHHTGFPGGLRRIPYAVVMKKDPTEIIRRAVNGMLPKNKLRDKRMKRLHIFADDEHPHKANLLRDYAEEFGKTFRHAKTSVGTTGEDEIVTLRETEAL